MEILADLRRWRLDRRARRARGLGPLPRSLELGTACALVELSRSVGTDLDSSIRRIVEFDAETLQVERVSFWSYDDETSSIHCEAGYVASVRSFEHGATLCSSELPEYFDALRDARTLNMGDVQTDPRCRGLREYCAARSVASMLDIPVWAEGRLNGVLCHEHVGEVRRWSVREEDFATCVSQIVASALAAHAHTQAEAASRRAAFLDTVSCVLSSLDPRELGDRALSLCVPKLATCALIWVQGDDGVLECLAMKHADPRKQPLVTEYHRGCARALEREKPSLPGLVVRQRQSLLIPDVTPSLLNRYRIGVADRDAFARLGLTTAMGVPLTAGGKTFGCMCFLAGDRHYGADDLALAESIAVRLASALENARLYEVAREAIRARDELLVLAAHELRTPLTALQLTTDQMLRKAQRNGDGGEVTREEKITLQVRRFSALVENILEALSIRADGVSLSCRPCDFATIVRDRVALVGARAGAVGSTIALESASTVECTCDRRRLERMIDALLDNALKFGAGKPIDVELRTEGPWAELSVHDRGIGFSADRLSALFHPFERAAPSEHFGGLGLGLYIAKAIVDAHGGSIAAISRPGDGATFVVRLPLADGHEAALEVTADAPRPASGA
jgi:signal transduction histidine kinase